MGLYEAGRTDEAIDSFQVVLAMAQSMEFNGLLQLTWQRLADCYLEKRDFQKAYAYQHRGILMEQHLKNEKRLRAISELEIQYKTAEKEKQLAIAEKDNALQARQLARNQMSIGFLSLGLFVTVLIGLNLQQKRRYDRLANERELNRIRQEQSLNRLRSFFAGEEKERKRIAADLHDSLGGVLYSLQLQLSGSSAKIVKQAIAENRRIIQDLLPATLAQLGLVPALEEWAGQFEQMWNLPVRLELPSEAPRLPENVEISLFRIAQELMHNAAKHGQPDWVALKLQLQEGSARLSVEDNGRGFDPEAVSPAFLKTVDSRTQLLGGQYQVEATVGTGVKVAVDIPLEENNKGEITQ